MKACHLFRQTHPTGRNVNNKLNRGTPELGETKTTRQNPEHGRETGEPQGKGRCDEKGWGENSHNIYRQELVGGSGNTQGTQLIQKNMAPQGKPN